MPTARALSYADDEEALIELSEEDDDSELSELSGDDAHKWKDHDTAWKMVQSADPHDLIFFQNLNIAKDGGILEVTGTKDPASDNLWYSSRYFSSLVLVVFVFMNIYFIFKVDIAAIFEEESSVTMTEDERTVLCGSEGTGGRCGESYLLTQNLITFVNYVAGLICGRQLHVTPTMVICTTEMVIFCLLLLEIVYRIVQVICTKCLSKCIGDITEGQQARIRRWERQRWFAASELFWELIPQVSIFSAMKLLFFITPQVVTVHINTILFYESAGSLVPKLVWFVFTRGVCAIIGFDSFLVKYRTANEAIMTDKLTVEHILGAVVLLNQILGVVQIRFVVRDRLNRFVFGGDDGIMSHEEKVRMDTWNALVCQKIWASYDNCFDRLALLLTFCDDDFQRMCLSEGLEEKVHAKLHAPAF